MQATELTKAEADELAILEDIITRGMDTFIEVGMALAEIRDRKLYKQTHTTFEQYLADRWDMSRSRAHRLIEAAKISEVLPTGNKPTNEAQARELVDLTPDAALSVMQIARKEGKGKTPTARAIRGARQRIHPKRTTPKRTTPKRPPVGGAVTEWRRSAESMLNVLTQIRIRMRKLAAEDVAGADLTDEDRESVLTHVRMLRMMADELEELAQATSVSVTPTEGQGEAV
jgi:hypothetical protein